MDYGWRIEKRKNIIEFAVLKRNEWLKKQIRWYFADFLKDQISLFILSERLIVVKCRIKARRDYKYQL